MVGIAFCTLRVAWSRALLHAIFISTYVADPAHSVAVVFHISVSGTWMW